MSTPAYGTNDVGGASNVCYRHPNRPSFVLCQRCGRTICPDCQTPAAVGFHCPECVAEARATAPRVKPRLVSRARTMSRDGSPIVTYSIIGVTFFVFVLQLVFGGLIEQYLIYRPVLTALEPWTMITSLLAHASILHILSNMFSLFIFGRILEPAIGRWRFLALYLISGLGGSVAVLLLAPGGGVLGASGAIFGLLGAFFVIQRRLGGNNGQIIILIVLNLSIGFIVPSISWQAHVGGLIAGVVAALILANTRARRQRRVQIGLLVGLTVALVAATAVGYNATFG